MWESILFFSFSKTKKKKKVDAARFLDARGDEKQVINLERPKVKTAELWLTLTEGCIPEWWCSFSRKV